MFLQNGTPDTSEYMIAGYLISFIVIGLYIASIYLRSRNLKRDMSMLEEMEKAEQVKAG
jgi:CcmD family protein